MTLFEALTGGAFDHLNWQHSGEFDPNFSKKVKCPGVCHGGGMGGFGIDRYITPYIYYACRMINHESVVFEDNNNSLKY